MLASSLLWLNFLALQIPICNMPSSLPCANMARIVRIYCLPSCNSLRGTYPVLGSGRKLIRSEPKLVPALVQFMDNPRPKLQCQALIALKYLAEDRESQLPPPEDTLLIPAAGVYPLEIVEANGLKSLLRFLQSPDLNLISAAVSCIRNVTLWPKHDLAIIKAGFLQPLLNLMAFKGSKVVQYYAAETLGNLAEGTEEHKLAIFDAGVVHSIKELIVESPLDVQVAMARCIRGLSRSGMHSPFNCLL